MTYDEESTRGQAKRSRSDRIARLRERVKQAAAANREDPIPGILQGVLDLLEDEL
jgi:hypothetical protein